MPRNMSFFLTTEQMRHRRKTVTRRLGWRNLTDGTLINACVKCMGLQKGQTVERIGMIRVTSVRREPLSAMRDEPTATEKEGFPEMSTDQFIRMFCENMNVTEDVIVTRIEFEHLEDRA